MTSEATAIDVDVLVVGAGPVGLALANELGLQSIRCLVIEQRERVGYSPRAKLTNVRTAELLRRWGLADELRRASSMPKEQPSNIVFTTRLNGHLLARFENAFYRTAEPDDLYSEPAQWVPQYTLEEVLRGGAARRSGVELRFNTQLSSLEQAAGAVVATAVDTQNGRLSDIRAKYVVGADGGRSKVRSLLGIPMEGAGALASNLNVLFRAPAMADFYRRMPAIQYWTVNPDACALMGPVDDRGLWYVIAARVGDEMQASDPEAARRLIAGACGMAMDVEIVDIDPWQAHCLMANSYASGRVFLAGDACHMHPPFGGHGMNMGIGDAADLGWKLAATVQGWGGADLLKSYEAERRPVHRMVMDESNSNYELAGRGLLRDNLDADGLLGERARHELGQEILRGKRREFFNLGLVLGYSYRGSPIVAAEATQAQSDQLSIDYLPSASPGSLAPHFWMRGGASLFDTFGNQFTLLVERGTAPAEVQALAKAAELSGLPLKVVTVDDPRFKQLYQARLAIVRPDQHIAWRGHAAPDDPGELVERIRGASAAAARSAEPAA